MHRWAACPGSVRESEGKPNRESKYAAEGTEAHDHAANFLTNDGMVNIPEETLENLQPYFAEISRQLEGLK